MSTTTGPRAGGRLTERRAIALANVRWFRAMARRALTDGAPMGPLRAANARAAARIVLQQARREATVARMAIEALNERVRDQRILDERVMGNPTPVR